jgi:hypothetical protein
MGDLNTNVRFPRDEQEETIMDLLDEYNVTDSLRRFEMRTPRRFGRHVRFTWSQKGGQGEGGIRRFLTPDYILVRGDAHSKVRGVGFRSPWFLHLDHRAVVANIRMGCRGKLKEYRRLRQEFPLRLAVGPQDKTQHPLLS